MKVVTSEQMRRLEAAAEARGISSDQLMEQAGLAVAERCRALLGGDLKGDHVTVLVGPGNNGGDGLVVARHLNEWGARVHVFLCAKRKSPDPKLDPLVDLAVDITDLVATPDARPLARALWSSLLVVDALLGTGRLRPLEGAMRVGVEQLAKGKQSKPTLIVVALDLPSGLDADTGACDPATPQADVTITLGYPKVGLFNFPGAAKV
ncbi:MAG: NAD(P)H-hydrate epimerase, partial [Chloroflexi bacterium]|nr:NAD(P)H-hydrate epimerase [Chloroflexota bacterium]